MKIRVLALAATSAFALVGPSPALPVDTSARPSRVDRISDEVVLVRDDDDRWGGGSLGITHQCAAGYEARKVLDLSCVPEDFWSGADRVRLSAFFCVRDYSWHDAPEANGFDEAIEVVVNGRPFTYPTGSGLPRYDEAKSMDRCIRWHDFDLPKEVFVRGANEIVFRKAPTEGKTADDYLYLGIDTSVDAGNSWVRFSPQAQWRQDKLTVPGGKGEYMVRLYLLSGEPRFEAVWHAAEGRTDDPLGVIQYAGPLDGSQRVEWDRERLDPLQPLSLELETAAAGPVEFEWLDERGEPAGPAVKAESPMHRAVLDPPFEFLPAGVQVSGNAKIKRVALRAGRSYHRLPRRVDMAPLIAPPAGGPVEREPQCRIEDGRKQVTLENGNLRCRFRVEDGRLRLASLYNEIAASEMVRKPQECALLMVEVDGKRYAGSRDFACRTISEATKRRGFSAILVCEPIGLEATLAAWIDEELHLGLFVTNRGNGPVDFKLAFPHLSGLAISDDPSDDYYFFPWGGGIISDQPAVIRRGYGDHAAIYQVMDLFSPRRGGGLAAWCTDDDGRYKVLALRKHVAGEMELGGDEARTPTADEYKWTNSLGAVPGVGLAYEYLRRTRRPDDCFAAKDVALWAHAGDWHAAMERYAAWCHRAWRFRPLPSRLAGCWNMLAAGWGQSPLFREGKYRTDFIRPGCDCIELMSWWEWSPLGPWRTPWDRLKERLGEAAYERYKSYYVEDPVTGQTMYPVNRGDYDGYNRRWGGLPAFREAIATYRRMGPLVTLYTDPLLACDNSRCGQKWGKLWGIVQPDGTYRTNYESWNMCHDVAGYRQYVADTMRRVMRETGADGIRLDEYGHAGAACFSKLHEHTFAEPGCTEWQRAISETTRMVRRAMDEVAPGSVLTTEHPGYDYLMPFIEGCITYDLTVQATPLRPLECNLQRFYFPECRAFELVYPQKIEADPRHRKRFWNAVGSFGSYYPPAYDRILREHAAAFESRNCRPLVPTLARRVYANRFASDGEVIYTLYNATGHTFAGPVLRLEAGQRALDLLAGSEARTEKAGDGSRCASVLLRRDDVGCIAVKAMP